MTKTGTRRSVRSAPCVGESARCISCASTCWWLTVLVLFSHSPTVVSEIVHYEGSRCPLAGPVASIFVLCQDEFAWLSGTVTLQVSGVDRHGQSAAAFEVSSDLEALAIARAAEDPQDQRPSTYAGKVEY